VLWRDERTIAVLKRYAVVIQDVSPIISPRKSKAARIQDALGHQMHKGASANKHGDADNEKTLQSGPDAFSAGDQISSASVLERVRAP
jgi:hypothetical protein